jgi:hypothetical protein
MNDATPEPNRLTVTEAIVILDDLTLMLGLTLMLDIHQDSHEMTIDITRQLMALEMAIVALTAELDP